MSATQSSTTWSDGHCVSCKMLPSKYHHCCMAAILMLSGTLLLCIGLYYKMDYCQSLTTTSPPTVLTTFTVPSNSSSNVLAKATLFFLSLGVMNAALIPWCRFKSYIPYQDFYQRYKKTHPSERLMIILMKYELKLISVEIWNVVVYVILSMLLCTLLFLDVYKPESLLLIDVTHYNLSNDKYVRCIRSFGAFIWFKPALKLILVSFLIMVVISSLNIYKEYLTFVLHRRVVLSIEEVCVETGESVNIVEFNIIRSLQDPPCSYHE